MINFKPDKVLVLMAHPDDEISCFGTLARFASEGSEIVIIFFTDGHQGLLSASKKAGKLITARVQVINESFIKNKNELFETREMVGCIDECIKKEKPSLVITHTFSDSKHHEHRNLSRMVLNSVLRSTVSPCVWFSEPISVKNGFYPNLFVDISKFMQIKLNALANFRGKKQRWWYLEEDIVKKRANWWVLQSSQLRENSCEFCEVFSVQNMVIR